MTSDQLIDFLNKNNINYEIETMHSKNDDILMFVYIHGEEIEIISFSGKKRKYTPYLRVSHFDEKPGWAYVRDNGVVYWATDELIFEKCKELGDIYEHNI